MPKNKFDSFYYGVGMKLDEASVDQAAKQLEGRLNKVVDKVTENLSSISDAVSKGVKDINTKDLLASIVEAQKELNHFQDFDPGKLQTQIDSLGTSIRDLTIGLDDVGKELNNFVNDVSSRLSNIEIKTSDQGKRAFKADLELMADYARQMANSGEIDTTGLDKYFKRIRDGFASLKTSGNSMELFADKDIAKSFVNIINTLQRMGDPVEDLRLEFFELSSTYKSIFESTNISGAANVFKNIGYQIEATKNKLKQAKLNIADYDAEISKLKNEMRDWHKITDSGDQVLIDNFQTKQTIENLQTIIAKIDEYQSAIFSASQDTPDLQSYEKMIALAQTSEGILSKMGSKKVKPFLSVWAEQMSGVDNLDGYKINDFSTGFLDEYRGILQNMIDGIKNSPEYQNLQQVIGEQTIRLENLMQGKKPKSSKNTKNLDGGTYDVQAKIKINETEWAQTINEALSNLETKGKIKPVKIPITTKQGTTLKAIQEQAQKIRDMALVNPKNEGSADIKAFNHRFDKFLDNIKSRREEVISEIKNNWYPALKDAFSFKMEVLGIDKKSINENIAGNLLPLVDSINNIIESKPIIFHSNIDTLVEEIQTKLQDIKIDIGAGNVNVNPQNLSNVNLIINGTTTSGGNVPPMMSQSTSSSSVSQTPPIFSTSSKDKSDTDKQKIYNDAVKQFKEWIDGLTNPDDALKQVKEQANALYDKLIHAEEGTQEYYKAQIQLATLLGKWRGTIGGKYAKEGFKIPGVTRNWDKYLTDNNIIPDPKNSHVVGSMSAIEKLYKLKSPVKKSTSTKTSKPNVVQIAEEQMADQVQAGRKIIENYIKLAKWAKALSPIAEGTEIKIKESDFKDGNTILRNGKFYNKNDIGTVVPGRKITAQDLDAFISQYENSQNEEDRQLFSFLKTLIDAYKSNQQKLDSLLDEFSDSDVVGRYEFSDNKTKTLATDIKSSYKTIMGPKGSKKARQHLTDVFKKYNIDLSKLPSAKTYADQWEIIEQEVLSKENFNDFMSELGSLKGNVGKTYENFMTLLKVSEAYMLASNSLGEIGQEASILMRGKREESEKEIKKYNPHTGRTEGTGQYIPSNPIVEEGLRQEINNLAVVFIDELGNAIAGFNAGKNIANDYLSGGPKTSFTAIVNFLTNALNQANQIAFDTKRKGAKGYENVAKWDSNEYTDRKRYEESKDQEPYTFTKTTTEKSQIEERIQQLENTINAYEGKITSISQQLDNAVASTDNLQKITELSSQIAQKQSKINEDIQAASNLSIEIEKQEAPLIIIQNLESKLKTIQETISGLTTKGELTDADQKELELLKTEAANIESQIKEKTRSYEDNIETMLSTEESLLQLRRELSEKKKNLKEGTYNKEVEDLKKEIETRERLLEYLNDDNRYLGRSPDDNKALNIIEQEENKLKSLRAQNSSVDKVYDLIADNKNIKETIGQTEKEMRKSKDKNFIEEQKKKVQDLKGTIEKNNKEIADMRKSDKELDSILSEMAMREKYIELLKNALKHRVKKETRDEVSNKVNSNKQELARLQTEQTQLESELAALKAEEDKMIAQEITRLQGKKTIAEDRIKAINTELSNGDSKDSERLQAEKADLEKEIISLNKEIELWNSKSIIHTINSLQQEISNLQTKITNLKTQLAAEQKKLTTAKNDVKYNKSYERAVEDLPRAQSRKQSAEVNLKELELGYSTTQTSFLADVVLKKQSGEITQDQVNSILALIPKISDLNQKFIDGKISYQDYLKTVQDAYILMHKATSDEAKTSAKSDAERLANTVKLVKKYKEEEKILKEIIRTQKPKEQPAIQSTNKDGQIFKDKPKSAMQTSNQSTSSSVSTMDGGAYSVTTGSNVLLNLGESGLAKDTTVRAIYELLSVKKNAGVDSQIEEIKKAIAVKKEEETKKAQEAENARKKAEEESKKAQEIKKAEEEAARKAAETEAANKKAEQERKAAEVARKKAEEKKKVEEKPKTTDSRKTVSKTDDILLDIIGKSGNEFWKAYRTSMQEIQTGQRVFREYSIKLNQGSVTGVVRGLIARAPGLTTDNLDTYGHLHPRDSLYSSQDFEGMKLRRQKNKNYNTDFLLTPNYIYKLDELKNASIEALKAVQKQFEEVESAEITGKFATTVKESYLHNFAQQNGVQFNKMLINSDGTTSDITQQIEVFDKDVLDKIIEVGKLNQQIISNFKNKQSDTDEQKNLVNRKQALVQELLTNELYKKVAPKSFKENSKSALFHNNKTRKAIDTTLIQEAVDFDFDLSLFIDTIKDFFVQMQKLGETVPANSPLEKIKTYIDNISKLPVDSLERKNLIEQIKPYINDVFKKNTSPQLDTRDYMLNPLKEIAKLDSSGQISKVIKKFAPKDSGDNSEISFVKMTMEELQAELSRLEALRDSGEVDPSFATAAKQDIIIDLLKNGIKVNGDKINGSEETGNKARLPHMPNMAKVSLQAAEIDKLTNVNHESALYKQYEAAKKQLDDTISSVVAKGKNRTKQDTDEIRVLIQTVSQLGKQILNSADAFEKLQSRGDSSFAFLKSGANGLEDEMRELAHNDALKSNSLLRDISYDEETRKLNYSLIDLEGNITKVTMAYNDLFGIAFKTSDKITTSASKVYNAIEGEMTQRVGIEDVVDKTPILSDSKQYQTYIALYNSMIKVQDELRTKGTMASKDEKNELTLLIQKVKDARKEFEMLVDASASFDAKVGKKKKDNVDYNNLESEMKQFALSQEGLTKSQKAMIENTWSFKNAQDGATYSVLKGKDQVASMSVIFDEGTRRIGQYTVETNKYKTGMEKFMTSLQGKWQEVARYLMSFGSLYRVWAVLKQGVQYVREIDSALTELKKVTDETEASYDKFLQTAAKTASKVGSTIQEIVSSTADWARLGYSMEEAAGLAESTSVLLNVSEFQSIEDATSALTSTLQAFSYTADESMHVVDVLNEVGNNFAISSDGIATALQDSASSLMAANNSYEEAVSLIAAANRVVQDPNSVGAALRTISLRLRGTSVEELEEAGEDATGVVTSKSKLRSKVKSLSGVDILTDTGSYKSTYEILLEISKVWKDMSDIDQAALLEVIAGKTRSNTAAAILSNTKDLEEAYVKALEAEGSALEENEKYLDSIQGRIDLFSNATQTMWNNALDDDVIKFFVNIGTELIKLVDNFGLIKTLIVGIGSLLIQKYFNGDIFSDLFNIESIDDVKTHLKSFKDEYEKAQKAYDMNHTRANKNYLNITKKKYNSYKDYAEPVIQYNELEGKLNSLKEKRQSLMNDLFNNKQYEDSLGPRIAAGWEDAADAMDRAQAESKKLENQIGQIDQEIIDTETQLKNVEIQSNTTGKAGMKAGQKIKIGFMSAKNSVMQFGKEMIKSMATMYVITTIMELITKLGQVAKDGLDYIIETPEEAQEKFEEFKSELSDVQSELTNLNSELESTQDRIDELMSQDSLSFTEQEELERLRAENDELERKIKLNKTLEESKQKRVNDAAVNATDKYMSETSFGSNQTKTEKQEKWKENGEMLGKAAGLAAGPALAAGLAKAGGAIGTFFGGPLGTVAGMAIGALVGGIVVGAVGEGLAGASYDSEQSVGDAMDNMVAQRAKLQKTQDEAMKKAQGKNATEQDIEAYNEATQALATYDEQMAKHITQIQANYNAMDWSTATVEQKKKMMEYADWLDKYSINMMGDGAKSNAIERIFGGAEASKELKNLDKQIKDAIMSDEEIDFNEMFNSDELADTKQRLDDLGISLTDLKYYYLDWKEVEEKTKTSTYETVKSVNSLSSGIGDLKDAFAEFKTEGLVTADTLVKLYDTFGSLGDAWSDYVDIMATGTASTKEAREATEELLEALANQQLDKGPISDMKEYFTLISQLQYLGVSNAKKYVDAMQKSSMISEIGKSVVNDKNKDKKSQKELINQYVKKYEEQYGITLTDKEKLAIEKAITAEKAKQNVESEKTKAKEHKEAKRNKENADEDLKKAKSDLKKAKEDQKKIEEYNKILDNPGDYGGTTELNAHGTKMVSFKDISKLPKEIQDFLKPDSSGKYYFSNTMLKNLVSPELTVEEAEKAVEEAKKVLNESEEKLKMSPSVDVDGAKKKAKDAQNKYQEALDDLGLKLQIELYESTQAIDDIQSVYDTLMSARKEYNEEGYMSVDTMQSLLSLEPKYLALLYDENGQLSLNEEALLKVAEARIIDMGITQQKAILEEGVKLAFDGSREALLEYISVIETATKANGDFVETQLAVIRTQLDRRTVDRIETDEKGNTTTIKADLSTEEADQIYAGIKNQVDAVQYTVDLGVKGLPRGGLASSYDPDSDKDDAFKKAMEYWENRIAANQARYEQIQNEIDLLEKQGKIVGKEYYEEQIKLEKQRLKLLEGQRAEARKFLGTFKEGSDEWWEAASQLNEIEGEIDSVTASIQDLGDAIANVDWQIFDEIHERVSNLTTELETIRTLVAPNGEEDWFDDEGMWTEKGVTVAGSHIQQIEIDQNALNEVNKKLAKYSKPYKGNEKYYKKLGIDSEQELYDAIEKLRQQQHDYTKDIADNKKAVVDMYEAQIDAVEEYTSKLIDSYNEYIDTVKEALDAERDLYEFKKDVEKQAKNIGQLERRISSLSGSDDAADIAERRKLEAELMEAKEGLDDTYYGHAKDSRQKALEEEAVAYEESMNKFIEGLRESLDTALQDMDVFMTGVYNAVISNAPTILEQYGNLGIALDDAIVDPWKEAEKAIKDFSGEKGLALMNSWVNEGGVFPTFKTKATDALKSPWSAGKTALNSFKTSVKTEMKNIVDDIKSNVAKAKTELNNLYKQIEDTNKKASNIKASSGNSGSNNTSSNYTGGGSYITGEHVKALQKILNQFFKHNLSVDGVYGPATKQAVGETQLALKQTVAPTLTTDGYYNDATKKALQKWLNARNVGSWFRENKVSVPAAMYAKGTLGTKKDEWAITDESWIGEEITLAAGKNGQLQYLKKGSAVMPADISANLVEWGKLDPNALSMPTMGSGVNIMSNAIIQPNFEMNFDSLVHVDHCDQGTLKDLERMVDTKINQFGKQMNYAIKKIGGR